MDTPDHKREAGTPDQLPSGEATKLNQAVAAIPAERPPVGPVLAAGPPVQHGPAQHANPMYSPTFMPEQDITHGSSRHVGPLPGDVPGMIEALSQASQDPNASPALKNLIALLQYHSNRS